MVAHVKGAVSARSAVQPRLAHSKRQDCVSMCDVDESDDQPLGYLMYRVMRALRPQAVAALGPLGIGLPELVCMRILSANPGLTSAELARDNHVSAQAMNQVLNGLQDRGAITRPSSSAGAAAAGATHPPREGAAETRGNGHPHRGSAGTDPPDCTGATPTQTAALQGRKARHRPIRRRRRSMIETRTQ